MKILINIKYIIQFSLIALTLSCSQNPLTSNKRSEIRFVDLQGNARKIRLNTPTENVSALTKQGKISQTKLIEEQNYKEDEKKPKSLSYNKYGRDEKKNPEKLNEPQKNGLIYTMNLPTKKNDQETIKKPISNKKSSQGNPATEEKEYDLAKISTKRRGNRARIISETRIPAESSSKSKKLKRGTYVQAGSFTRMSQAKRHLRKVKRLTNNPKNVNIQSAKVRNRNYYRVVIGPVTKKKTAKLIIKDLKKKGQNSIIIKVK